MRTLLEPIDAEATSQQRTRWQTQNARTRRRRFVPKLLPPWPELEKRAKSGTRSTNRKRQPERAFAQDGNGCIRLYLREIGRVEILTPRQEERLILQVAKGNRRARERLIKASLRRVVEISRDFEDMGLPLLDLISEGNVGLLKAIEHFEPCDDTTFSAASTWWIRQSIKRALTAGPTSFPQEPAAATNR